MSDERTRLIIIGSNNDVCDPIFDNWSALEPVLKLRFAHHNRNFYNLQWYKLSQNHIPASRVTELFHNCYYQIGLVALGEAIQSVFPNVYETIRAKGYVDLFGNLPVTIRQEQKVNSVAYEPQKKAITKYETVHDIISDEDNFGLIVMNLYLQLEKLWAISMTKFIELGIDIPIDQNTMSQKKMKGKFYLESLRQVSLSDFLSNLDAIGCELVKDIDAKLQELNANVVHEKKAAFSGKNEVASWCSTNGLSHLYDQLIGLGYDSITHLKKLDDQACTEMGIKGRFRTELMEKVKLIKN